eukprot:365381-Chlamydomonas_euryale.AAC.19
MHARAALAPPEFPARWPPTSFASHIAGVSHCWLDARPLPLQKCLLQPTPSPTCPPPALPPCLRMLQSRADLDASLDDVRQQLSESVETSVTFRREAEMVRTAGTCTWVGSRMEMSTGWREGRRWTDGQMHEHRSEREGQADGKMEKEKGFRMVEQKD